jgi:RNA polymerase subunit RPABC4/transcription elongation factor Spt4
MRYCSNCKKLTAGKPPYCNFCGRSYGVRLCPRGHNNPRAAEACSECGSMELSTPAPKGGTMKGFSTVGKIIGVAILLALSGYVLYFVWQFLTDPDTLNRLLRLGIELCGLFALWMVTFGRKHKK